MTVTTAGTDVLRASALELAAAIRNGELTSREVVEAHIARLEAFQKRTGAIAVPCYDAARETADAADAWDGDERPPLLGVPCTIKESFACEGLPNAAGLVSRRDHRAPADAPTVANLRAAGAIPLGLTNTSELCMWMESTNKLYGRTSSAYSSRRVAGGSSGGEGAAVGSGGSPFGLGSDIGGSVRFPAYFNGVFGHKPSPGLLNNEGQFPVAEGDALRLLTPGPLCRRAEDLMPVLEILAGQTMSDPADVDLSGMEVVVAEGGVPPVSRRVAGALYRTAGALQALGARVRTKRVRRLRTAFNTYLAELSAGNTESFAALLGGEGDPVRLRDAMRRGAPHTAMTRIILATEPLQRRTPAAQTERLRAAGQKLADRLTDAIGDGVLLYPPYPWVAPRHGFTMLAPMAVAYAAVFNLTPTAVTETPVGLDDRGLPLGVQVVARAGNDHVTIAVAQALERALGGWVDPASLREFRASETRNAPKAH